MGLGNGTSPFVYQFIQQMFPQSCSRHWVYSNKTHVVLSSWRSQSPREPDSRNQQTKQQSLSAMQEKTVLALIGCPL